MKVLKITILLMLFAISSMASAQIKNYTPINYGPKNYGKNFDSENLAIAQSAQGLMYFGTAQAVFEYDGYSWKRIFVREGVLVYSLLPSASGDTIFVGGNNEFGYLSARNDGNYDYMSLSDSIRNYVSPFHEVRKIYNIGNKVYYQCEEYIFEYSNGEIAIIPAVTTFHTSFCVNDRIYIRQREFGLNCLDGDSIKMVPGGEVFANIGIFGMIPTKDGKCLIISYEDGSWIMDSTGIVPNTSGLDEAIAKIGFGVTSCSLLNDNTLALGSYGSGILVIRMDGTVILHKTTVNGLIDNSINSIFCDRERNLWLTTNKGITLLPSNEVFSMFSSESGIEGSVNCVIQFNGRLYVGTSEGMFAQNTNMKDFTEKPFVPVGKFNGDVWCFANYSGSLIVGTSDGLFQMGNDKSFNKIGGANVRHLSVSSDGKYIFVGGDQGLTIYEYNDIAGFWLEAFSNLGGFSITGIESVIDDNGNYVIWLGTSMSGFTQVRFDGFDYSMNSLYSNPAKPVKVFGQMCYINNGNIFTFEKEKLDEVINGKTTNFDEDITLVFDDDINTINLVKSDDSIAWISQGTDLAYIQKGDTTLHYKKFSGLDAGEINCIYTTDNKTVWLGTINGLVLCDNETNVDFAPYFGLNRSIETEAPNIFINKGNGKIRYKYNSMSFVYSAPWFQIPGTLKYSYYLEGWMKEWSKWTSVNHADFSSLREGKYTFKVKASNVYGDESSVAEYTFSIRPPWYRTLWAYLIYIALLILLILAGVKYYTYQLKERNRLLDLEVKRQTKQINAQLDTIKEQNESLTDSINYAARIQRLSLPNTDCINKYVAESFILFKPRDIVSGDFYWCAEINNRLVITAADCTGHGVPGAMMSMLGMNSLNSIVKVEGNDEPGLILNELRASIVRSFADKGKDAAKDGMDLCLLSIDAEKGELQFAGAHNPLFQISKGELTEHKTDRMPCALSEITAENKPFTTNTIKFEKGDCFYFLSDGYCDQFGGADGRDKFKKSRFKQHLLEIWEQPMEKQRELLSNIHNEFKGEAEQIDDILVIGLRM